MIKRLVDILASFFGLLFFSPILLPTIFLIWKEDKRSPFYVRPRLGKNGKSFKMIKLRSMEVDADKSGVVSSSENDTRITPIGHKIRKYKLDELIQLWNVLIGDMSLVGPRPDVSGYADKLKGEDRKILKLRPGITGTASLKYANEEEILAAQDDAQKYNDEVIFPDKVKVNLEYYENQTIWLDIKIIFATIFRTSY